MKIEILEVLRDLLKKVFCKHKYVIFDELPCTFKHEEDQEIFNVPVTLLVCKKCKKRKLIKYSNYYYNPGLLKKLKLWEKGLFDWEKAEE